MTNSHAAHTYSSFAPAINPPSSPAGRVLCRQCGASFKSAQGLAGHRRFRHGDAEWSAAVDRAQAQRLEALQSFAEVPGLPTSIALLVAKLQRRYSARKNEPGPTDCVICGAITRTPQGLSGHMRYRHGAGGQKTDRRAAAELIRYINTARVPPMVAEALWEKVLRLEGFRW